VLWLAHRGELLDQAEETFRELAPKARIFRNIRGGKGNLLSFENCDVLIISKQTLEKSLRQFPRAAFQYVVIDEAHHAYAEGYQTILEHLARSFTLGITATPRRFTDRKHIRDLFGPCAIKMNLLELVRAGILIERIRFRKVETNVELEAKLADSGEFSLPHFWKQIKDTARNEIVANTYFELEEGKKGRPALAFCVSVEHAQAMAEIYRQKGIRAEALHGKLSPEERARILADFESGKLTMLTCVDILNEGYDFPPLEVILMARPTRSKTIWLQQIGRGTRKSPSTGKEDLLIIDFVDNLGAFRQQITFEEIFKPKGNGAPRPAGTRAESEGRKDVYIEGIIDMELDEIFDVIPLQPHELTTTMLASRTGVSGATIRNAIKDGRIESFVRRNIIIKGIEASVFAEEDVEKMRAILVVDQLPLQPHELTPTMLAGRIGINGSTILHAINDGRIQIFVRRTIIINGQEASVFAEEDVAKIRVIMHADQLPLQPNELTTGMLAKKIGVSSPTILRAIIDGRIESLVRRKIMHAGNEAPVFSKEDIEKIRAILHADQLPLQPNELTTGMLAERIGVSQSTILRAIKDGRIRPFVRRTIRHSRGMASVFSVEDIDRIRAILHTDQLPLQPNELTTGMLAVRIGVNASTIYDAIKDGRIQGFVRRKLMHAGREASVFAEEDVEKIKRILGR